MQLSYFSTDHALFAKKVRLVWANCKAFNKGTTLEKAAQVRDPFPFTRDP